MLTRTSRLATMVWLNRPTWRMSGGFVASDCRYLRTVSPEKGKQKGK